MCDPVTATCRPESTDAGGTDAVSGTDAVPGTDAGTDSGLPTTCDPLSITCDGSHRVTCAGDGTVANAFLCPLGCVEEGGIGRCLDLVSSAGIDIDVFGLGSAPTDPGSLAPVVIVNTDNGEITDGSGVVLRSSGGGLIQGIWFEVVPRTDPTAPDIGVFAVTSVTIPDGVTVRMVGGNAGALIAPGEFRVDGVLESVAGGSVAGAGGSSGGAAGADGVGAGAGTAAPGALGIGGGGGGGFCGLGGDGGSAGSPGLGGVAYGTPELTPLLGGSGGGGGSNAFNNGGTGGGGGGALYVASLTRLIVGATGAIHAGGGGGGADAAGPGGGGGSGGGLLLEAPEVSVELGGVIAVNGGGGGGSDDAAAVGEAGQPSATAALGGGASGMVAGGDGSSLGSADGLVGMNDIFNGAGGGGGGAGRIRINTRFGVATVDGLLSPGPATGCVTEGAVATE